MKPRKLKTEERNPASAHLDTMNALEIATLMNREDARVLRAVKQALPQIAQAIDLIAEKLAHGGRLIYVGTGTSGRIGALDAAEIRPTFGTKPGMVQFVMAGGAAALARATEASEDSQELGGADLAARNPRKTDVVVGIAASGRTPYTIAALEYARTKGAATIAVVCNHGSELALVASVAIEVNVGPEVLTGSTRLKAGTAQKMVCNMLSTGAMARLGYVFGNLMVNLQPRNKKLYERGLSILEQAAQVERVVAVRALQMAEMNMPLALVMLKGNIGKREAQKRLKAGGGAVRKALQR